MLDSSSPTFTTIQHLSIVAQKQFVTSFTVEELKKQDTVAQCFELVTSMLEVSSSKSLASESKGFAFWVEVIAPGLPSADYLSYVVCELLHRRGGFTLCAPKG